MIDRLYKLIWLAVHIIVSIYETLCFLYLRFQALIIWSYDFWQNSASITRRDRAYLLGCKAELTKLPKHLNLIIGPDQLGCVNESVVTNILSYAQILGIDCVSLYDVRSEGVSVKQIFKRRKSYWKELQHNQFELGPEEYESTSKDINKNGCNVNGYARNGNIVGENGSLCNGNAYKNISSAHMKVYQISNEDNRPLLAKICRKLFQQRDTSNVQKLLADRKQLEQHISEELANHMQWNFVDPDLSIIFNRDTCSFGVLPWQTRFTEFQTFETGRYMNAENFANVLYKYSKCEQRWGK
ncbi:dehydrodolichyl diphosphate synthase complex subunit nus1 [Ceratitis capitata]|uniref:ditrans,polycis-polyprenyl diphosphate synthase [(2E,6E)-farnesyldiphosphate specific] n=1 Tax=Ceratitis capitata TaxID=7213 RepID=A0A811USE8_CERCA|nr:dehydrodolichyl diphosphate synthase complex subunit nus1 [Ceratitis capitata]CAD7000687.1 unnamed protein product [Ceratitis capitata]